VTSAEYAARAYAFRPQDIQRLQEALVSHLAAHPLVMEAVTQHVPADAAKQTDLAKIRKSASQRRLFVFCSDGAPVMPQTQSVRELLCPLGSSMSWHAGNNRGEGVHEHLLR